MGAETPRYVLKPDPHSSHSIILRWLGAGDGRRLLDVGAADGILARKLTEAGWRVTAIEGDEALARAGAPFCERTIVADLNRGVPEVPGPFDAVVFGDVLEHLVDPLPVLSGLAGSLAPDGFVILSVPNVAHFWIRLCLLLGRFDYLDRGILDRTHLRFFTERSMMTLVRDAGLRVERYTATPAPIHQVLPPRWHRPWLRFPDALSAALARGLPRLLGYQLIVRCRRLRGAAPAGAR